MPLADYQSQIRTLVAGPGTDYQYEGGIEGWIGYEAEGSDLPLDLGHAPARDSLRGVPITFKAVVKGAGMAAIAANITAFLTAWMPGDETLEYRFKVPGVANERVVYGRPRRVAAAVDQAAEAGRVVFDVQFFVTDPRRYDAVTGLVVVY